MRRVEVVRGDNHGAAQVVGNVHATHDAVGLWTSDEAKVERLLGGDIVDVPPDSCQEPPILDAEGSSTEKAARTIASAS